LTSIPCHSFCHSSANTTGGFFIVAISSLFVMVFSLFALARFPVPELRGGQRKEA
jgi:hypothetical protein